MTCYNCGSPYHYSDKCPKPKKVTKCHNCGQSGHKMDRCPNPKKDRNNRTGNDCPQKIKPNAILHNMLETKLQLKSMWGANSALISEDCLLFKLKTRFIDQLLINGLIQPADLDEQNRTPHININGDQMVFVALDGLTVSVGNSTIRVYDNYIALEINKKYHMTLIFKNNIISVIDTVYKILDNVIGLFAQEADIQDQKLEEQNMLCCICMSDKKDIMIVPCNHLCVCNKCIGAINDKCPICRGVVDLYEKIYL